jgi:hypothetical protein
VRRVFASGYVDRPTDRVFMVTLTAPGERQHRDRSTGRLCPCTPPGGVNLATWNATAGRRWSDFVTYLRRQLGEVQYAKAAECQRRGAVHFHALIRCDKDLTRRVRALRRLAVHLGFGHELDVQSVEGMRAAGYCAKYASKATDDRQACPWADRRTGEVGTAMRLRTWTASRSWGTTMATIRAEQRAWANARARAEGRQPSAGPGTTGAGALDPETASSTPPPRGGRPLVPSEGGAASM